VGNSSIRIAIILASVLVLLPRQSHAQVENDSSGIDHRLLPLAFYLPETGLALGGLGILTFRLPGENSTSRPSQIIYSAAYTTRGQLLIYAPFEMYAKDGKRRHIGEIGYYRYSYSYYGLGPDSELDDELVYRANFPRVQYTSLWEVIPGLLLGAGAKYDHFSLPDLRNLTDSCACAPPGAEGGNVMMWSATAVYDTRDVLFYPTQGLFAQLVHDRSWSSVLSDYSFSRWSADLRAYLEVGQVGILASRIYGMRTTDDTPFYHQPYISSGSLSRGFPDRRFISDQILSWQQELRFPIRGRFYGAGFYSFTHVGKEIDTSHMQWSLGGGVRYVLDEAEGTRIRLDVGVQREGWNFYLTVNEAF